MTLYLFRQAGTTKKMWVAVNSKFWLFLQVIVHRRVYKEVKNKFASLKCATVSIVYSEFLVYLSIVVRYILDEIKTVQHISERMDSGDQIKS